jgi:uncharacterized membrane protein
VFSRNTQTLKQKEKVFSTFRRKLQNKFIAGIVIVFPIGITIVLLGMMFTWLDSLFVPIARRFTDRPIPGLGIGLGIISTILIIFGVGLLVTNIVGRAFVGFGETLVAKIPFIRNVYSGAKQFLETLTTNQQKAFNQVVLIEYPKKGSYTIGFVTADTTGEIQENLAEPFVNVFVATTPNPTTGFLLMVPQKEARVLPISVEDGVKMVVSGGIINPPEQQKSLQEKGTSPPS